LLPGRPVRLVRQALPAGAAFCCVALVALTGCGGGSRADAGEKSRHYEVQVLHASFPAKQAISRPATMELTVHNSGSLTVPDLAITVDSFNYRSSYVGLADPKRPIWVIEQGPGAVAKPPVQTQEVSSPGGGQTAYVNTWAFGALRAGATQTFTWKVVAVRSGARTVHYSVAAGLAGKATATLASGGPAAGKFEVQIASRPGATHVDPKTGKVVTGSYAEAVPTS
jgi:hypothetical protein